MKRKFAASLTVIIGVLFQVDFVASQENYEYERMWPAFSQPWYFAEPRAIASDLTGNLYIVDTLKCSVEKYSSDGFFQTRWGRIGSGDGEFRKPQGIAVDAEGSVYIVDTENHRIQKFNSDGTFVAKWGRNGGDGTSGTGSGEFWNPQSVAIDTDGNVYVADFGHYDPQRGLMHRIQKFDSRWTYITEWEVYTAGDGRTPFIADIAVTSYDGLIHVYVVDKINHLVKKFDSVGNFITSWGGFGSDNGDFSEPNGIAIDKNGNIYVADMYNARIQKFDTNGVYITQWGEEGSGEGEFKFYPTGKIGVAIDSEGYFCVGDHSRIQKFTTNGIFLTQWSSFGADDRHFNQPGGLAIDLHDYVYVVDSNNNCIKKFDAEGNHLNFSSTITNLGICDDVGGEGDGEFDFPTGIAIDADGYIYVADGGNHRVQKFYPDGTFYNKWESEGVSDITIDAEGFVYVSDQINHRIQKFDLEGNYNPGWGSAGSNEGEFNFPHGVATFTTNGDTYVYVADSLNHRVQKFRSNGEFITEWGAEVSVDGEFRQPVGITVDAEGYIYVSESSVGVFSHEGIDRVQKFRDTGTSVESVAAWGTTGPNPGQLDVPHDLAVHSNGKVYIVETINNRVQVFSPIFTPDNPKAIIVAGRASAGDSLWGATQVCTNFAHRALIHQGFTKEDIYYLSADTDLDLDRDGEPDVNEFPYWARLQYAITGWAIDEAADHLIVYLNDHGGADTFTLHEWMSAEDNGILKAGELKDWLDVFQERTGGRVSVVYEACESGSFLDELQEGHDRTIITSTLPDEKAKFLNGGTISFSSFIWTNIFNGFSLEESFLSASQAVDFILSDQTPQIRGDAEDVYIGKSIENLVGDAPVIRNFSISELQETEDVSEVTFNATVTDVDGVARVWAMIWLPDYVPGASTDPLLDLTVPPVELLPAGENSYEGTFENFTDAGIYQVIVYAMDRNNNISQPQFGTISYHVTRRAIILAGDDDAPEGITQSMIETNARLAYNALISQGYTHDEIYFFMRQHTTIEEVDEEPLLSNINGRLISESYENLDLVIFLIGDGDRRSFSINGSETLYPYTVNDWLRNLEPTRTTIIYDADMAGSFVMALTSPEESELIVIASTGGESHAYFSEGGDICFSTFFWNEVAAGVTVNRAFKRARNAISFLSRTDDISFSCYNPLDPLLDANGNGISNEGIDYQIAESYAIGLKMNYADEPPQIGYAAVEKIEGIPTIVADNITPASDQLQRVWAVIRAINYCPNGAGEEILNFTEEVDLVEVGTTGRYEWESIDGSPVDAFMVTVYAMDTNDNTSPPKETKVYQEEGGDIYEDPDNDSIFDDNHSEANVIVVGHPTPQPHTFHYAADEDWIKFYGRSGEYYTIEVGNLEEDCEPTMVLYDNTLEPIRRVEWAFNDDTVEIEYQCPEEDGEGIYYVALLNNETDGESTGYDIKVYQPYPRQVMIAGRVIDRKTRRGIDGAYIKAGGTSAAISVGGGYELWQIPGTCTINASASGYSHYSVTIIVGQDDEFIAKDILMTPNSAPTTTTTTIPVDCTSDEDCYDDLFCNGGESCDQEKGVCIYPGNPCSDPTPICDEDNDRCVAPPEPSILLRPSFCFQSRWIPLPVFIRIEGENTHFNTSTTEVNFSPKGSILALPFLLNKEGIFLIGLMMPSWLAPVDTIEVSVKGDPEEMSELLTVKVLPFFLNESTK